MVVLTLKLVLLALLAELGAAFRVVKGGGKSDTELNSTQDAYAPGPIKVPGSNKCWKSYGVGGRVRTTTCYNQDMNRMWYFDGDYLRNVGLGSAFCLTMHETKWYLSMETCEGYWNQKFKKGAFSNTIQAPSKTYKRYVFQHGDSYVNTFPFGSSPRRGNMFKMGGKLTIVGRWNRLKPIFRSQKISFTYGNTNGGSITTRNEWSEAVSRGFEIGLPEFHGISTAIKLDKTVSRTSRTEHHSYWETKTEQTDEQYFERVPGEEEFAWQWVYDITTDLLTEEDTETTKTGSFAATASRDEEPRCVPAYCREITCQQCSSGGQIV